MTEPAVAAGDLADLPYTVTVPLASRIAAAKAAIKSGGAVPVTAARVGERLYAIDKIDAYLAHRELGSGRVPCVILEARTLADAQALHVNLSLSLPTNPFLVSEAVRYARDGGAGGIADGEHTRIDGLALAPETREAMSKYITSLGARTDHIPSFFSAFRLVSRLDRDAQAKAVALVIKYCDKMGEIYKAYSLPEPGTLETMLEQFADGGPPPTDEPGGFGDGDGEYGGDGGEYGDGRGGPGRSGDAGPDAEAGEEAGYYHNPDADSVDFRCKCGLEYVFNAKSRTIREREDAGNVILLHGDHGVPVYALRGDAAEYLELALKPSTYYYPLSGGQRGDAIIISKKRLSRAVIEAMGAAAELDPGEI